jgi:hypothetical protein
MNFCFRPPLIKTIIPVSLLEDGGILCNNRYDFTGSISSNHKNNE